MIYFSSHQDSYVENILGLISFESLQTLFSYVVCFSFLALKIFSFEKELNKVAYQGYICE